ncbi:MAG TPA: pitrilysin family protein [Pirellulales bacterium]|nr:pitrilysin family protein [Pirellulales bacterium]
MLGLFAVLFSALLAWPTVAADPSAETSATSKPAPAKDASNDTALKAADALYDGIRAEKLDNGLRVYLKPVAGSPVVTTMVAYRVGSADEDLDNTGLSHYLEHLMFKGTDKLKPGDIDRMTQINGGQNNAYTTNDYTIFHFDFAADRWDLALRIEADRMQNLRIDEKHEFQEEKGAVISELERDEDEPWDLEQKTILPLLFGPDNPYGHPVIGQKAQVRAATAAIIKAHYDKWYHPNNASLIICGGFDPDQALARVKELFGPIPSAELPSRKPNVPVEHKEPVHKEFTSKFDVPRMLMGFNTVDSNDPDLPALEFTQAILSGGKTSRFYKDLVEGAEIATSADAFHSWGRYPGWFGIQVELLPGKDRQKAEQLVVAELQELAGHPVPQAEMDRVRQLLVAGAVFDREAVHQLADNIAQGVSVNSLDWLKTLLPRIAGVTAADVQRVAKKYLDPQHRVVVWSVPKPQQEESSSIHSPQSVSDLALGGKSPAHRPSGIGRLASFGHSPSGLAARRGAGKAFDAASDATAAAVPIAGDFSLKTARRVKLPNGLVLLLWENHRLPIVVAEAFVDDVSLRAPGDKAGLSALMGDLLDEGTPKQSGPQIAEAIENVGGALSFNSAGGSVKVLSGDRSIGLSLLIDCLRTANFPAEAFAREQQHQLAAIDDAQREPMERGGILFRKLVYGKHPLGRPALGTKASVEKLTSADCAALRDRLFVPDNMLMAVAGDFNPDEVVDEIKQLTSDWKPGHLPPLDLPKIAKPKEFVERFLSMPEAAQLQFFMGQVGIRRANPDYYKLLVLDYVLGTGTGFTDRLSSRLRDREGLAYTVTANITSSAGEEPGTFSCYIGTEAKNLDRAKKEFLEELERIRTVPPKTQEVDDVKKYLLGSLPFQFTTNEAIAAKLLLVERFHLGFDYLADYRHAVEAVTPDDVQAVAHKYIDPSHMILVAAGAIDTHGKPLEPPASTAK